MHNPDWKILAFAGAAGIVATIGTTYLNTKVAFFQAHWYAVPLVFVGAGALLLKKMPVIGIALGAMGAAVGYIGYQNSQTPAMGSGTTSGFTDAGRLGMRTDSGLFERGAGAIMGAATQQMRAAQGAGAIMGPGKNSFRASQAASGFTDAGKLDPYS